MERSDFFKLINVLNYDNIQSDFFVDFPTSVLIRVDVDELYSRFKISKEEAEKRWPKPYDYESFKKVLNIKLAAIEVFCNDCKNKVDYFFNGKDETLEINADTFTLKEAITIINLVTEHQRLSNNSCVNLLIRDKIFNIKSGDWWNFFINKFLENCDNLKEIRISFGYNNYGNDTYISFLLKDSDLKLKLWQNMELIDNREKKKAQLDLQMRILDNRERDKEQLELQKQIFES